MPQFTANIAFLFPELERSMRLTDFGVNTREDESNHNRNRTNWNVLGERVR